MADFSSMIEKERDRLNKLRDDAMTRRNAVDDEIAAIDTELRAITAYETAKTGKKKPTGGGGGKRASRQDGIVQLLTGNPDGMTRGELLDKLGLKGNKAGEQSVSNALGNMKKAGKLGNREGKYVLA